MKTTHFLLITLGLIFTIQLNAQNDFKIGVNAGLNYPDIRGNYYAKYNNFEVGYLVGLSFDYSLKGHLSLKSNINYERKIKTRELTFYNDQIQEIGTKEYKEVFDYINLPFLLKYEFLNDKLFVNGGPFFNYLLSTQLDSDYPNDDSTGVTEKKKIDVGFSLGFGTTIPINEKNDIAIEIRDDFGLIDTGGGPIHADGTVKTNTIKLILSWNMGI